MMNKKISISFCVRLALGLLLGIGTMTFLRPCVHDGAVGTCHWAGQVLFGLGIVMAAQAAVGLFWARQRAGISLGMVPVALMGALTPGTLIPLCMMETMRCNAVMKPGAILISAVIGIMATADALALHLRARKAVKP